VADMLKLLGRDYLKQARPNLIRAGLGRQPAQDDRSVIGEGWRL
jgi:hypothetical protein